MEFKHEEKDYVVSGILKNDAIRLSLHFDKQKFIKTLKFHNFPIEIQKAFDCVENIFDELKQKEKVLVDIISGSIILSVNQIKNNKVLAFASVIELAEANKYCSIFFSEDDDEMKEIREDMGIMKKEIKRIKESVTEMKEEWKKDKLNLENRLMKMEEEMKKAAKPAQMMQISQEKQQNESAKTILSEIKKFKKKFSKILQQKDKKHLTYLGYSGGYKGELEKGKPSGIGLLYSKSNKNWKVFAQWQNGQYNGNVLEDFPKHCQWSQYKDGKRHGRKIHLNDGIIESQYNFQNGIMCGIYRLYKKDGSIKEQGIITSKKNNNDL